MCYSVHGGGGSAQPPPIGRLGEVGQNPLDEDPPCRPPGLGRPLPSMQTLLGRPLDADLPGCTESQMQIPPGWTEPPGCRPPQYGQQASGMHPTGMHTVSECLLFICPRGVFVRGGLSRGWVSVTETPPPPRYGGRADGTHPTGIDSC